MAINKSIYAVKRGIYVNGFKVTKYIKLWNGNSMHWTKCSRYFKTQKEAIEFERNSPGREDPSKNDLIFSILPLPGPHFLIDRFENGDHTRAYRSPNIPADDFAHWERSSAEIEKSYTETTIITKDIVAENEIVLAYNENGKEPDIQLIPNTNRFSYISI